MSAKYKNHYTRLFYDINSEYKLQVSEANREFFKHILESAGKNNLPSKKEIKISTQGQQNLYDVFNAILGAVKNFSEEMLKNTLLNF